MRRRGRALTADIPLTTNTEERLSGMSPIFMHRMVNLSPIFQLRSQNYLVCCDIFSVLLSSIAPLFSNARTLDIHHSSSSFTFLAYFYGASDDR
jgi:hypothetical protein